MIFKLCGAATIALFFVLCVFKGEKNISFAVTSALCGIIAVSALDNLLPLFKFIDEMKTERAPEYLPLLLKALGIGIVTSAASSLCQSAGEKSLAGTLEFFGKSEILVLCIPLVKSLLSLCGVTV